MAENSVDDNSAANSPYMLQQNDNPGASLVTCLLKEDNYATWQRAMTNALLAKDKFSFVNGSLPRPAAKSKDEAAWIKGNSMVISWLFNSLHSSLHDSVAYFDTAKELWDDLGERFSQGNAARVHQLKMEIVNTQQGDQTVVSYYTKLKGLWDEYGSYSPLPKCTCGASKEYVAEKEKEKVHQFLMGLKDKFNVVRSQILNTDPLPTLARVYGLVTQEERQQQIAKTEGNHSLEGAAFVISKGHNKPQNFRPWAGPSHEEADWNG